MSTFFNADVMNFLYDTYTIAEKESRKPVNESLLLKKILEFQIEEINNILFEGIDEDERDNIIEEISTDEDDTYDSEDDVKTIQLKNWGAVQITKGVYRIVKYAEKYMNYLDSIEIQYEDGLIVLLYAVVYLQPSCYEQFIEGMGKDLLDVRKKVLVRGNPFYSKRLVMKINLQIN